MKAGIEIGGWISQEKLLIVWDQTEYGSEGRDFESSAARHLK